MMKFNLQAIAIFRLNNHANLRYAHTAHISTHSGLGMPYGDIDLGQYYLG